MSTEDTGRLMRAFEALVREHFGALEQVQRLRLSCENPQGGVVVRNEDIVIWGRVPA